MKTTYTSREYDTLWWKQRAAVHQQSAHAAIAYAESAVNDLKRLRDQKEIEARGTHGVTDAAIALKSLLIAVDKIWPYVTDAQMDGGFEPGVFAEVKGQELYRLIAKAKEAK